MVIRVHIEAVANDDLTIEIEETSTIKDILSLLASKHGFGTISLDKISVDYNLYYGDCALGLNETLESAHVQDDDTLILAFASRGAAIPDSLIIAASIATITELILDISKMWARRLKNKKVSKAKKSEKRVSWNEVKEIRVLMSDGKLVKFDSWLTDPSEMINFINAFYPLTKSPQPLHVTFLLENGTQVQLVTSNDTVSKQELDTFIHALGWRNPDSDDKKGK